MYEKLGDLDFYEIVEARGRFNMLLSCVEMKKDYNYTYIKNVLNFASVNLRHSRVWFIHIIDK